MAASGELFDILDGGEEVQISKDELKSTLQEMGHNVPDNVIEEAMTVLDKNNSGTINFSQFMEFFETHLPSGHETNCGVDTTKSPDKMEEQLKEQLKPVFDEFDTSGDGTISKAELGNAISKSGKTPPDPRMIDALFKQLDRDGRGSLDFNEFVLFILSLPPPPEALKMAFDDMDTDGSGCLSKEELQKLLKAAGKDFPDEVMDQIIVDIGGKDEKVSFDEFCKLMGGQ